MSTTGTCTITLLGETKIIKRTGEIVKKSSKTIGMHLLARLALPPFSYQPQLRSELGAYFWPGATPDDQLAYLRYELSMIRKHAGEDIFSATDTHMISLSTDVNIDVMSLQSALQEKRWRDAITVYTGDLLPQANAPWIIQEKNNLRNRMRSVYITVILKLQEEGDTEEAETLLGEFRKRFPQDDAPQQGFQAIRPLLPSLPLGTFIGRDSETQDVYQWLNRPASQARILTIVGPGGTGKTRLALQTAHQITTENPERWVAFVALEALDDSCLFAETVLRSLLPGVTKSDLGKNPGRQLAAFFSQQWSNSEAAVRNPVLILDNLEQLMPEVGLQISQLLEHCRHLRILATSRQRLRVHDEHVIRLAPLAVHNSDDLSMRTESASAKVFKERASLVLPSFAPSETECQDIEVICRILEGLPLAIEIVASRVDTMSLDQMRTSLESDQFSLLDNQHCDVPARHRSIQATLEWSWQLLTVAEQNHLSAFAVFEGGFCREAAKEVLGTTSTLESLCQHNLIVATSSPEYPIRYHIPVLTRAFLLEKATPQTWQSLQEAHLRYFRNLVFQADDGLRGEHERFWLEHLDTEQANLRAALRFAVADASNPRHSDDLLNDAALHLVDELYLYYYLCGQSREGLRWLEAAIAAAPQEPKRTPLAAAYRTLGIARLNHDGPDMAEPIIRKAIGMLCSLLEDYWARISLVLAWNTLSRIHLARGEWDEARNACAEGISVCESFHPLPSDMANSRAFMWEGIGEAWMGEGDLDKAETWCEKTMEYWKERGMVHDTDIADSLGLRAHIDLLRGDFDQAMIRIEDAFVFLDRVGSVGGYPYLLYLRGRIEAGKGQPEIALQSLREALSLAEKSDDKHVWIRTLELLSILALSRNEQGETKLTFKEIARMWGRAKFERRRRHFTATMQESNDETAFVESLSRQLSLSQINALFQSGEFLLLKDIHDIVRRC
jgi:predicted ATPase